jgi:hypothetical protein
VSASWQEMEALLDRLVRLGDPAVREDARALVRLLMGLHGEALARLVEITRRSGHQDLLDAWKADEQVNGLLLLHGLHPDELTSRVRQALAEIAPVAAFLRVEMVVDAVREEEVRLTLNAAPDVPPAALAELRERIEAAVAGAAPEVQAVRFDGGRRVGLPLL